MTYCYHVFIFVLGAIWSSALIQIWSSFKAPLLLVFIFSKDRFSRSFFPKIIIRKLSIVSILNNSRFQFLKSSLSQLKLSSYENLIDQSLLHKNFESYKDYLLLSNQYKKDFPGF